MYVLQQLTIVTCNYCNYVRFAVTTYVLALASAHARTHIHTYFLSTVSNNSKRNSDLSCFHVDSLNMIYQKTIAVNYYLKVDTMGH